MANYGKYDVVIIGASADGIELCEYLITKNPKLKIAFVSSHFRNVSYKLDLSAVTLVEHTVVYSSYIHGLIGFTLEDGSTIFGINAVIATGSAPERLPVSCPNIFYKKSDVRGSSKRRQAIVVGNNSEAVAAALWAAKKFKYVYICSPTFTVSCGTKNGEKLKQAENIVILPNSNVASIKTNAKGNLLEATLDTYDTIKCGAIIAITKRTPEVPQLAPNMINIDADGYIEINHFCETGIVPRFYALGSCTHYPSKHNVNIIGKAILSEYKED